MSVPLRKPEACGNMVTPVVTVDTCKKHRQQSAISAIPYIDDNTALEPNQRDL